MKAKEKKQQEVSVDTWESDVRSEINALLDRLLPPSVSGSIQLKYSDLVLIELETGTEYDNTKAVGAQVIINLNFDNPINKNLVV